MKEIYYKQFKNFEEFYDEALSHIANIATKIKDSSDRDKITYIRNMLNTTILRSYFSVCNLSEEIKLILSTNTYELNFSMDNMIKNIIIHPEVRKEDYAKIPSIVNCPSKFYKSKSGYDVILFRAEEKYYKLVIKTTKNKEENFVKSLHFLNKERYYKY